MKILNLESLRYLMSFGIIPSEISTSSLVYASFIFNLTIKLQEFQKLSVKQKVEG